MHDPLCSKVCVCIDLVCMQCYDNFATCFIFWDYFIIIHFVSLQLAYAAATNVLTDRSRFKNFFRTLVSFRYIGASLGQLMREFGWRQMSIITQDHSLFTSVRSCS